MRCRPPHCRSGRADCRPGLQPGHLVGQPGLAHRLRHQPGELVALLGRERVHQLLRAAARRARASISSSRFAGCSGKNSPYSLHELRRSRSCVCSPRASASSMSLSALHHLADALEILGRRVLHRVAHARRTARRAPRCAAGPGSARTSAAPRASATGSRRAARTARGGVVGQRVQLGLGHPGRVVRDRGTARAAPPRAPGRAARAPARACRRAGRCGAARGRARGPCGAATSSPSRPACRGAAAGSAPPAATCPARTSSPISSSACRMSNGGSSGSGPPAHCAVADRHGVRSCAVDRPGAVGVLGQPAVQVQALEGELEHGRRDADRGGTLADAVGLEAVEQRRQHRHRAELVSSSCAGRRRRW